MRVDIGPYRSHLIPIRPLERLFEKWWYEEDYVNSIPTTRFEKSVEKLFNILYKLTQPINNWWFNRERKIKIQYHDYDTWNFDSTLALIILPGLKQLKSTNHGYSYVEALDAPLELDDEARWLHVQDEMIWAFEQVLEPENFSLDIEAQKAYDNRIRNGLILFGKYFRALWD